MMRIRVQYMKTGVIRYTSHLDTVRMFQRGFRACGIPVAYSQGYHPHPRMSFGPPLKTGWEGLEEYFDCHLDSAADDLARRCNPHLPEGLRITGSAVIPDQLPKLPVSVSGARFIVRLPDGATADPDMPADVRGGEASPEDETLMELFERATAPESMLLDASFEREGGRLTLEYTCTMRDGKYLPPDRFVQRALGLPGITDRSLRVTRAKLFIRKHNDYVSPLEEGERLGSSGRD